MWRNIKRLYVDAWAFAIAAPILFSIPFLLEFAQHVIEIDAGLYRGDLTAAWADPRRTVIGFAKGLAMLLPGYWFVRYLAMNGDHRRAKRIEWLPASLFGVQFVLFTAAHWLRLFGPPPEALLGINARFSDYLSLGLILGTMIVNIYLTAWYVAWPLGNVGVGPLRSAAIMHGSFWRTAGYVAAGVLPLTMLHYALGYGAVGRPEWLVWIMMTIDAMVIGILALTTAGAGYVAANDAAKRTGVKQLLETR